MAALGVLLLAFPALLEPVEGCVLLGTLFIVAVVIHVRIGRDRPGYSPFGPLVLFAFAFVMILGVRAVSLTAGVPGRYFVYDRASGLTESLEEHRLGQDEPEIQGVRPEVARAGTGAVRSVFDVPVGNAFVGDRAARLELKARGITHYLAIPVRLSSGQGTVVAEGQQVVGGLAVRSPSFPPASELSLFVRFETPEGNRDVLAGSVPATKLNGQWLRVTGRVTSPPGATRGALLLLVRDPPARRSFTLMWDAPVVLPGPDVARELVPRVFGDSVDAESQFRSSLSAALSLANASLCFVLVGFLMPLGAGLGARVPPLRVSSPQSRSYRWLLVAVAVVGAVAWLAEMATYGGYAAYFNSLQTVWTNMQGRWYLHMMATLPAGVAVMLGVRRVVEKRPMTRLEAGVVLLGVATCLSYWTKSTIALPLLTFLLAFHFARGSGIRWIVIAATGFAVLTPYAYWVRGGGKNELSAIFREAYWTTFFEGLTSRFFHFESLMLSVPHPNWERPWTPLVDLSTSVVPRAIWADKPVSASARYTREFLLPGLGTGTDVGVMSLPGEFWLLGGALGIVLGSLLLGVLIRVVDVVVYRHRLHVGALLSGCGLLVGLLLLNDGEGFASVTVLVLVASIGWIVFLRPGDREGPALEPTSAAVPDDVRDPVRQSVG